MAVAGDYVPAEGRPLVRQRPGGHNLLRGAVQLHPVAVNDRNQVVQLELGRGHGRLPDRALVKLTVAEDGVHIVVQPLQPHPQRHTLGGRQADAQRPRRHIHPGRVGAGVPLQKAPGAAQGVQGLLGEVPLFRQHPVEHGGGMALAQYDAVLVRPIGHIRIELCMLHIQYGQDLTDGQGAARMAGLDLVNGLQHLPPEGVAERRKRFAARLAYHIIIPFLYVRDLPHESDCPPDTPLRSPPHTP